MQNAQGVIAVVYVDDIGLFGPYKVLLSIVKCIQEKWKTSDPSWTTDGQSVGYCGVEIFQTPRGWRLCQLPHLTEILNRYNVTTIATAPMGKWEEPPAEDVTTESVKEAQAMTFALLWAVTRSRPDLMYPVSKMSQFAVKSPRRVIEIGTQVLAYVKHTLDYYGIDFAAQPGPVFGTHGQLAMPRSPAIIELYSDSFHSPDGVALPNAVWCSGSGRASFGSLPVNRSQLYPALSRS